MQRSFAYGALAGYGEHARDLRDSPDVAKQWLLFVQENGVVSQACELHLSDRPAGARFAAIGQPR